MTPLKEALRDTLDAARAVVSRKGRTVTPEKMKAHDAPSHYEGGGASAAASGGSDSLNGLFGDTSLPTSQSPYGRALAASSAEWLWGLQWAALRQRQQVVALVRRRTSVSKNDQAVLARVESVLVFLGKSLMAHGLSGRVTPEACASMVAAVQAGLRRVDGWLAGVVCSADLPPECQMALQGALPIGPSGLTHGRRLVTLAESVEMAAYLSRQETHLREAMSASPMDPGIFVEFIPVASVASPARWLVDGVRTALGRLAQEMLPEAQAALLDTLGEQGPKRGGRPAGHKALNDWVQRSDFTAWLTHAIGLRLLGPAYYWGVLSDLWLTAWSSPPEGASAAIVQLRRDEPYLFQLMQAWSVGLSPWAVKWRELWQWLPQQPQPTSDAAPWERFIPFMAEAVNRIIPERLWFTQAQCTQAQTLQGVLAQQICPSAAPGQLPEEALTTRVRQYVHQVRAEDLSTALDEASLRARAAQLYPMAQLFKASPADGRDILLAQLMGLFDGVGADLLWAQHPQQDLQALTDDQITQRLQQQHVSAQLAIKAIETAFIHRVLAS
jgi:hypothetical protein